MSVINALGELVKSSAQFQNISAAGVVLSEKGRQATLKEVSIISLGSDIFGIKYDKISGNPCSIIEQGHPCCKACDAIIFCQADNKKYILVCELKSTLGGLSDYHPQLKSAACFLAYLDSLLHYFYGLNLKDWQIRYFLFHERVASISKRTTWPSHRDNLEPAKALPIQVKNKEKIYLRKLLSFTS